MSSLKHSSIISMDRAAKNCIKISLKLANSIMAMTGIVILMYSSWMVVSCFRDYQTYSFPWFMWACLGTGSIFMLTACIGHAGADTTSSFLLSLYTLFMFLIILVESLVTANICLNEDWDKDFPKDRTKRFDDFVHYVDSNLDNFKCLGVLIAFSQMVAFFLAMVLRTMGPDSHMKNQDEEAALPFLNHPIQHLSPYAIGHPEPLYYPTIPPPSYVYPEGYSDVMGKKKGEYVAATTQVTPKDS